MKRDFYIFGEIVDGEFDKMNPEDICPLDFKNFADEVDFGDEVVIHINSCGGSVSAGVSIANMIQNLKCKTVSRVEGIAASIASVIACSCSELRMGVSSFLMVHQVWGNVCGNSDDLRKEARTMEIMTRSLVPFYKTKFDLTDDEIIALLQNETWISGADASQYKLNAIVDFEIFDVKYAAKLESKFNIPTNIRKLMNMKNENMEQENPEEEKKELPIEEVKEEVKEEVTEEVKEEVEEEVKEEQEVLNKDEVLSKFKEYEEKIATLTTQLAECQKKLDESKNEDVEKRIAKCQSTFQNKINNFKTELKAKDEELQNFKNSVSRLETELENSKRELHEMSAAFEEKKNTLAKLNANVLKPESDSGKHDWRNLKGEQFIKWAEAHIDEIKNNKIN